MVIHLSRRPALKIQRLSKTKILGLYVGVQIVVFLVVIPCSLVFIYKTTTLRHNPNDHKVTDILKQFLISTNLMRLYSLSRTEASELDFKQRIIYFKNLITFFLNSTSLAFHNKQRKVHGVRHLKWLISILFVLSASKSNLLSFLQYSRSWPLFEPEISKNCDHYRIKFAGRSSYVIKNPVFGE
jgi:hypothetical protein